MLHRFSVLVAFCALVVIVSGAVITSSKEAIAAENATLVETPAGMDLHPALGIGMSVLTFALAVWLWTTKRMALQAMAMVAVVLAGADVWVVLRPPLDSSLVVLHAWLAPVFFTSLVAVARFTSSNWMLEPELVDDRGLRFLRPLAIGAPPLVLVQIVLGAMYRHKEASVFWHMAGALLVSLATLIASMVVIQQYPAHRVLRNSATVLMSVVLVQVGLGVAAFTMQLLETENTLALAISTVSHVATGNLTLAASLVFTLEVQRCMKTAFTRV